MARVLKAVELRLILQALWPDIEDDREDNEEYEHPMTAVGVVLLSVAMFGKVEPRQLALFTGYSCRCISAINSNMQNNRLWINDRYDASTWLSADGTIDGARFFDHIEFACGSVWKRNAHSRVSADPCKVYWDERKRVSQRRS